MSNPSPHESPRAGAIALMYHALSAGDAPDGQDPHYTLAAASFEAQLKRIAERAGGAGSARDWLAGAHRHPVLLTFDDGHVSNHRLALPLLTAQRMTADFFVNPAKVGQAGFASWQELRDMSAHGMSIQSHGYDHVYLTALAPAMLRETLRAARQQIEDRIGQPATLLAPPGGRMPRGLSRVARECGYTHVLSSRPGRIGRAAAGRILPRMAVTSNLGAEAMDAWMDPQGGSLLREQLRYGGLALVKQLLGDDRYERLRGRALRAIRGAA